MATSGRIPGERADLMAALCTALSDVRYAYVYGSLLTPGLGDESGIDVGADFGHRLAFEELDEVRRRCAEVTGRDLDLMDLLAADPIIRMQIVRFGAPVVVNGRTAAAMFAMRAVGEYLDFKIDRRAVEAAMREPHAAGR
jgi:predicted nucleotidyltransferase